MCVDLFSYTTDINVIVSGHIEARNKYFNSRTDDGVMNNLLEKNYMKDLLETLKIIVNKEFGLEVL